jgi:hypothetical protein
MNLQTEDDFMNEFPSVSQFNQQLETLQSQLPSILSDYQKYYRFYNTNPENQEYQQMFENIKANLNNVNAQLFTLSNDVQSNTNKLNSKLFAFDVLIRKEKKKNSDLKNQLGISNVEVSDILIDEYKEIYQSGYLRNWALFFSILIVMGTIAKIYQSKIASTISNVTNNLAKTS